MCVRMDFLSHEFLSFCSAESNDAVEYLEGIKEKVGNMHLS